MVHYKNKKVQWRQTDMKYELHQVLSSGPLPPPPRETSSLAFLRLGSAEDSSLFSASQNRAGHRHPNSFGFLGSRRRRKPPKTARVNALWHVGPGSILPTPPLFLFVPLCFLSVLPRRPAPFRDCRSYFQFLLNCFQYFFILWSPSHDSLPVLAWTRWWKNRQTNVMETLQKKKITLFSGL